jgi:hypothetical protein
MLESRRYRRDRSELPATLRRSCPDAHDTFTAARDNAVQVRGEGDQAGRAAFTALKEKSGKRGDHRQARSRRLTQTARPAGPGIGKIIA